jgi:hypothetical protein
MVTAYGVLFGRIHAGHDRLCLLPLDHNAVELCTAPSTRSRLYSQAGHALCLRLTVTRQTLIAARAGDHLLLSLVELALDSLFYGERA